ncbi:hypothetical protein AVEN_1186-1 [Araneus ventricosus]|uniref:Uncharacterized protein n=1 Tax=Araneus ventricosus TaxID=182803 RepID=A0A4Y2EFG3_ARAVE|nr:hypothetical protein AVEN_1186-1 [Araneus ventricosus]
MKSISERNFFEQQLHLLNPPSAGQNFAFEFAFFERCQKKPRGVNALWGWHALRGREQEREEKKEGSECVGGPVVALFRHWDPVPLIKNQMHTLSEDIELLRRSRL